MNESAPASRSFLWTLFAGALLLRLLAVVVFASADLAPGTSAWSWGHEPACIAQALLDGRGYSDPWGRGSGATSWLTPPYPVLLALTMKLCGGVTPCTAWVVHSLHAFASALTALVLVRLGEQLGSARAGRLAGWLFALYPIAISNSAQLVWDTTLVGLALTLVFASLLRAGRATASVARTGVAYGALLLLNPAPLTLGPIFAWFIGRRTGTRGALVFVASAFAVCLPWLVRNQLELSSFSLRPNFGVELRIGNHDEANGRPVPFRYHPSHVASELALYRELGEVGYARENADRAYAWIRSHPGAFLALTCRRATIFWFGELPTSDPRRGEGRAPAADPASWLKFAAYLAVALLAFLALARAKLEPDVRVLLTLSLIAFGVPYYLSHVSERYRFPIDPLLVLLGGLWITQQLSAWRERHQARP